MAARLPWESAPASAPEPKGPDPLAALAYRSAVAGADAYRSVLQALRREDGVLRVGNRFVADGRYREVAFVAAGHAANSMALATLSVLDERVTQGYLAGPQPVADGVPFRGVQLAPGWGGDPAAPEVVQAVREIAERMGEADLLLLLLSPGAFRALGPPPDGLSAEEMSELLEAAHRAGATGREVGLIGRVLAPMGGATSLVPEGTRADVETLLVERGDGASLIGGGPTVPVRSEERVEARAALERTGLFARVPPAVAERFRPDPGGGASLPASSRRPVVVAGAPDALRGASDATFDKGWTVRLGSLLLRDRPRDAAVRFLEQVETVVRAERPSGDRTAKGLVVFAMVTLDRPEGTDEGPPLLDFLDEARRRIARREMSVGLFRTAGAVGAPTFPPGAVVGATAGGAPAGDPASPRTVAMQPGITDVGLLAVAVLPRSAGS